MAISSNNIQVYTTLSKELVAEIDKDAKANYRTRSHRFGGGFAHAWVDNRSKFHTVTLPRCARHRCSAT